MLSYQLNIHSVKNIVFIALLLLLSYSGIAQIITPPLSRYRVCPIMPTAVINYTACTGWWAAGGTPDYFNLCDPGPFFSVPQNGFGHQNAIDSGYYGLVTYDNGNEYKEYIGTTCAQLVVGRTYTVSIQASLAEASGFASDGLGVFFSTYSTMVSYFGNVPQIDYSSYGPIVDSVNWVTLTSTFVADSAYTHLYVGCFKRRGKTNTVPIPRVLYGPWNNNYYSNYLGNTN
ncbi:MAG: hypothetical protein EBZ77_10820, partial [Chitinophagia bacterium]|nr:hypothetical protein [Chitinophagia bacterium]